MRKLSWHITAEPRRAYTSDVIAENPFGIEPLILFPLTSSELQPKTKWSEGGERARACSPDKQVQHGVRVGVGVGVGVGLRT